MLIPKWKWLKLTKGYKCKVDTAWFEMLSMVPWFANNSMGKGPYAWHSNWFNKKKINEAMARVIMDEHQKDIFIDHKNGNTLDNRVSNLRRATLAQNNANGKSRTGRSTFKNVHYDPRYILPWIVKGQFNNIDYKYKFRTLKEAKNKSNEFHLEFFGEYSIFNRK